MKSMNSPKNGLVASTVVAIKKENNFKHFFDVNCFKSEFSTNIFTRLMVLEFGMLSAHQIFMRRIEHLTKSRTEIFQFLSYLRSGFT